MIAIKGEIGHVAAGEWTAETSVLRGAPHISRGLVGESAPPIARIDDAFGDCNLVCACPPVVMFAE